MSAPSEEKESDSPLTESVVSSAAEPTHIQRLTSFLGRFGVETNGIGPVPDELRVDGRTYQLFTLWFTSVMNITSLVGGATGPVVFKLSFKTTVVTLVITNALSLILPAYFAIFGPKLGTRSMVQARFSWGAYGVILPSVLSVISSIGILVITFLIAAQLLARATGNLSSTDGIVINALITLVVSFCGYRVIHWFTALAWIPSVIAFVVMLIVGGRHLGSAISADEHMYPPPTVATILSYAAVISAGNTQWCTVASDYGVYHDKDGSSAMIFIWTFLGTYFPTILAAALGAAFVVAASDVPSWRTGSEDGNNFGGLVVAILEPCGRFGTFLVVIMVLAITGLNSATMYAFGNSMMNISSIFAKVPRYVYAIVATAVVIPLAIVAQAHFYSALVSLTNTTGYWSASFSAIIFVEHILFRRRDFSRYKLADWNNPTKLPPGLAALLSFCMSFALLVPCMRQTWYVGAIAKHGTGDIGVIVGFFGTCVLYGPLRAVEIRMFPGHDS
ncbi:cytosine-purine permease [Roridomyces roridus]|uniref:Cytosine-purine permease n=1 Tax=Roridomyces roridus TaxID=1738132 RepID=A0AAD7C252_9AGAR|nr:cytosine-purine permease [Roridomyces roridus]